LSKRLIALLAGVMAIAIVTAGCGSSDDSTTDTGVVVLTKTEFITQGDAICDKGSKQIEDEADEFATDNDVDTENPSKEDQEEVISTVVAPALQTQADELGALGAPEGEEDTVAAIVEALDDGARELEDDPASLLEESGTGPLDGAEKLATAFGFKKCGQ
jgi:ABC-type glycerol-3-phosphate transport system substrate-binding protein